jgi:cell division protein FtsW (lipid II flippase)
MQESPRPRTETWRGFLRALGVLVVWLPLTWLVCSHNDAVQADYDAAPEQVALWNLAEFWTIVAGGLALMGVAYWPPRRAPRVLWIVIGALVLVVLALGILEYLHTTRWSPLVQQQ